MSRQKVFISYRRDDAAGFSHAVHDRLAEHLPKDQIFMDVTGIEAGEDYVKKLESAVDRCQVLIALIGKRWASNDNSGKSRLQDPDDWVRVEVGTALRQGVRVIPVLLDGATLPALGDLPEELRPLTRINAMELRTSRLDADVWDLTGSTIKALGGKWPPDEPGGKIYSILAGIYALCAGGVVIFVLAVGMFTKVPPRSIVGAVVFAVNAAVLLRLPIHQSIRTMTRQRALLIGAILHLIGFAISMSGGEMEFGLIFIFALVPASSLFLGSFAMRRLVRS